MRNFTTDVVIVGGGAAGCYAALELAKHKIESTIVCKGLVGKSGASIFAGNLVLSGELLGNTPDNARNTAEFLIKYHNQFLIDQEWARRCGQWIANVYYPELEEAGLYFRRDDAGEVVTSPGLIRSVAANVQGNSGVPFMDLRRKQVSKAGVRRIEEAAVTAVLRRPDGSACGVFAVDCLTGEYIVVSARAVILATGYSDRLHTRSTGTREMSADGIAMARRAGAKFVNLEMQWWHTNDVAHPPSWQRVQIYPNPMLGSDKSARMVNAAGEEFFNQQVDAPMAYGPYTVQLKALVRQVRAGKASYEGGYFAGFDHARTSEVDAYTTYAKPFRQLGLDPQDTLLETAVTAHYRQGGVHVDTATMQSSVEGLFVAGGLGGHSNGLIALATFDGKTAAEGVAASLDRLPPASPSREQVDAERDRLERLLDGAPDGVSPVAVKEQVRRVMWENVGVEKDAVGMRRALDELRRIRQEVLPALTLRSGSRRANYEWLDAMDVHNMVDAAELIVLSSLQREESRGPFIRTDYPETDNENWLAENILCVEDGSFRFERKPYPLPFFQPGFAHRDNMAVEW
ncbi:MAG: FAD-binding protein [Ramlibacter sp.]|nr:FAD-binding protein [Ramlibacter sp.]